MIWYYLVLLLILFSLYIGKGKICKKNRIVFYVIVPIFICFGYMIGADWRMYELEFYDVSLRLQTKEPSYYIVAQLFHKIGVGFWEFSILYKLIGYYVFLKLYIRYSTNNIWGLIYWFPNYALFLWMDHPARNFMAIIVYSCALLYIENKKPWKYLLLTIVASSFHATCLIMIPIYFIVRYTPNKKYGVWLIGSVAAYAFASLMRMYMEPFLDILNFGARMEGYLVRDDSDVKMSIVRFAIFFFILLVATLNIEKIRQKEKYADFILKLSFIYVYLFCIGNIHVIFFRFQYFLMIPICVLISYICEYNYKRIVKIGIQLFILLFSFVYMQNLLTRNSHYIPYSNYIEYIFTDKPSYIERSNYNPTHSPYRDGD